MRNIALQLAYDGSDFVGSQLQNDGRTIQGALEDGWLQLTQERRRFTLAGRTDAGVHAQGQVANVRSDTRHPVATIMRGLNAILPDDVRILAATEVDGDFHARHTAVRRDYRYLIENGAVVLPMLRQYVVQVEPKLNLAAMAEALALLEGTHDFKAFTTAAQEQRSTVRQVFLARLSEIELMGRRLIAIDLAANAFLHHMVRMIVGTVLLVGRGRMGVEEFGQVLRRRDRKAAGPTAPAHGLTLMAVGYPANRLSWDGTSAAQHAAATRKEG